MKRLVDIRIYAGLAMVLLLLCIGQTTIRLVRLESTIGKVHWWRDNQMYSGTQVKAINRMTANKYLAAADEIKRRVVESADPNIYFFGGHPSERPGVWEFEFIPWMMIPLWVIGLMVLISRNRRMLNLVGIGFILALAHAIRYEVITNQAIIPMAAVAYSVVGMGMYQIFMAVHDKLKK